MQRQNNQVMLNLGTGATGEARSAAAQETEIGTAKACLERPAAAGPSMETVVERNNMRRALGQVRRNKGAPGADGMTVDALASHLKEHWPEIPAQLLDGTYQPQPVRRVEIPKASGGTRLLGIPCVIDRLIQQAALQVLQADWDPTFSEHSYGFRPGRSAHQAVKQAQELIASGHGFVVDFDLEKFFDRVNHDILMGLVAKRVTDKRILKLIRGFLTAGVLIDGLVGPTEQGTPQGGPLSPLLSNLMLDVLDKELETRGHHFVRYADDCVPRTHRRKEVRNCVRDGGRSSGAGRQGQASNHRKLRRSKAGVVSVAEKAGLDPVRYGSERRARANR